VSSWAVRTQACSQQCLHGRRFQEFNRIGCGGRPGKISIGFGLTQLLRFDQRKAGPTPNGRVPEVPYQDFRLSPNRVPRSHEVVSPSGHRTVGSCDTAADGTFATCSQIVSSTEESQNDMYFATLDQVRHHATGISVRYPVDIPPASDLWYEGRNPIDILMCECAFLLLSSTRFTALA
jgi:hypothetical protein